MNLVSARFDCESRCAGSAEFSQVVAAVPAELCFAEPTVKRVGEAAQDPNDHCSFDHSLGPCSIQLTT